MQYAALYERLSRDDDLQGESNSIKNQKAFLEHFAMENGWEKISFTADELKEISRFTDGQRAGRDGAVYSAAGKMCRLSEENCAELCATAGRGYGGGSLSARYEQYTRYKTSANGEEGERARQEYLDMIGLHNYFRW